MVLMHLSNFRLKNCTTLLFYPYSITAYVYYFVMSTIFGLWLVLFRLLATLKLHFFWCQARLL